MTSRKLSSLVTEVGARDADRKLFDEIIPLPEGTTYNAYLIEGKEKIALIDAVDPLKTKELLKNLDEMDVSNLNYVISNHAEQDHSGSIPAVLEKFPEAKVVTNQKCAEFLKELLHIKEDKFIIIDESREIDLGGATLQFIMAPWVHWPETMLTYLKEEKTLFTCDLFGSHYATEELISKDDKKVYDAAKRYYAEIMMPFRQLIKGHLKKLENYEIDVIAPSHGPVYRNPGFILDAYSDWVSDEVKNKVAIPYVSMHGSTRVLVDRLAESLKNNGVEVKLFNITDSDIGEIAMAIVDAATIVIGSPTMLVGAHPSVMMTAYLANILKPKTRFISIIGSYGWAETESERIKALVPNLKAELLSQVVIRGLPNDEDLEKIDALASEIRDRHKDIGVI